MTSGVAAAADPLSQGSPLATDACSQKKINENNRRSNKPIMEKKRRARINNCLNELKTLILDVTKKDPARHSKLEKADILEMTVKHLESVQRHNAAFTAAAESAVANKFKAGFAECTNEVSRFPGLEPRVRDRLVQHLGAYFDNDDGTGRTAPPAVPTSPEPSGLQLRLDSSQNSIVLGAAGSGRGVQLVPTRLPNGDIALILPSRRPTAAAAAAAAAVEQQTVVVPSPVVAVPTPPSTVRSESSSSGTESPAPDDRPSSRYSLGSSSSTSGGSTCSTSGGCDDGADTDGQPELPLALATATTGGKHRSDDQQSDIEQPWRPW